MGWAVALEDALSPLPEETDERHALYQFDMLSLFCQILGNVSLHMSDAFSNSLKPAAELYI